MAELPKSLRIGYRDYTVEWWPTRQADQEGKLGLCNRDEATIKIAEGYDSFLTAEVLLHEVLHAAYHMGCIDPSADEEKTVSILGNQMTQIWRDNPDFVTFMSDSLNPPPDFPDEHQTIGTVVPLKQA